MQVEYADWSDSARAGMSPAGGEAALTALLNDAGGLSLYLERGGRASLLHVEVSEEDARRLYEFLRAQFGGPARLPREDRRPKE
jgi:hypothetical protein